VFLCVCRPAARAVTNDRLHCVLFGGQILQQMQCGAWCACAACLVSGYCCEPRCRLYAGWCVHATGSSNNKLVANTGNGFLSCVANHAGTCCTRAAPGCVCVCGVACSVQSCSSALQGGSPADLAVASNVRRESVPVWSLCVAPCSTHACVLVQKCPPFPYAVRLAAWSPLLLARCSRHNAPHMCLLALFRSVQAC
jgi:hypothetical protein